MTAPHSNAEHRIDLHETFPGPFRLVRILTDSGPRLASIEGPWAGGMSVRVWTDTEDTFRPDGGPIPARRRSGATESRMAWLDELTVVAAP